MAANHSALLIGYPVINYALNPTAVTAAVGFLYALKLHSHALILPQLFLNHLSGFAIY